MNGNHYQKEIDTLPSRKKYCSALEHTSNQRTITNKRRPIAITSFISKQFPAAAQKKQLHPPHRPPNGSNK